jgi:hypothetical protein
MGLFYRKSAIFEPHSSVAHFLVRLKAKRLGEGGTQTFDDHKYITGNSQMQGL